MSENITLQQIIASGGRKVADSVSPNHHIHEVRIHV